MKKTILYVAGLLWIMATACFNDKGSYNYHDICEVTIDGLEASYNVSMGVSVLEIDPTVQVTIGDADDTTRFQYEWRATIPYDTSYVIGTQRVLNYPVSLNPGNYTLYFRVMDKETSVIEVTTASLSVNSPYGRGILLSGENEAGEVEVEMIAMTANDTVIIVDILANSGLPALHGAVDIFHTGNNDPHLWLLTKEEAYYLDRSTFGGEANNNFERLLYLSDDYGEKFIPVNIVPRIKDINGNNGSSYDRVVVCSNGYVFAASLLSNGGEFYTNPVNCEDVTPRVWLKAKPYLLYSLNSASGYMWYDETNERFMLISSTFTTTSSALEDFAGDPFPWNQGNTGRTMVYGENTRNTDGGSTNGNSFAIMKDQSGQYFIYKFYVNGGVQKRDFYTINSLAVNFENADFYAFSSRRSILYYAVGSTLYAYDYNKNNEKLFTFDMQDEITMLKCDVQIDPTGNPLYIATYNSTDGGTLQVYVQGTNPDVVELTPVEEACWTGLTKIKSMSWRAVD